MKLRNRKLIGRHCGLQGEVVIRLTELLLAVTACLVIANNLYAGTVVAKTSPISASIALSRSKPLLQLPNVHIVAADGSFETEWSQSYVVLISQAAWKLTGWQKVARILQKKYKAPVIIYSSLADVINPLRRIFPRYACFVMPPEEAGRNTVVTIHRMMRRLDSDPYADVIWSVLTGYDVQDALRIARYNKPLTIKKALSGTAGTNINLFDEALKFDETNKGVMWVKQSGKKKAIQKTCPTDTTSLIVGALNKFKPDVFFTSGHATPNDWQMGYRYRNGQLRCDNGQLFGLDTQGRRYNVNSPNAKIFLPLGNCLIGRIPRRNCMSLAMMHTAGVYQMLGYTVVTFYGYAGWGVQDYLLAQPGRFDLAQSVYCNQQALLHEIATRFPQLLKANPDIGMYGMSGISAMQRKYAIRNRDELGLLWDRDVLAFYGDPAWIARLPREGLTWQQSLAHKEGNVFEFTVTTVADGKWPGRPLMELLPFRVTSVKIISGKKLSPVITDNFIMLPMKGSFEKGERYKIAFKADIVTTYEKWLLEKEAEQKNKNSRGTQANNITTIAAKATNVANNGNGSSNSRDSQDNATGGGDGWQDMVPARYRKLVTNSLHVAGGNKYQLISAIKAVPFEQREAMAFLIAYMPKVDLKNLTAAFLTEDVEYAFKAKNETPWGRGLTKQQFFNYVLPYANVNERRDCWRRDFYHRFMPLVLKCKTASQAVLILNKAVYKTFNVKYNATKRHKPDQSPYESAKIGYASCTGLSIMLIDACRAVGIPARFVGIPLWVNKKGNHSWVEIWDKKWKYLGASEQTPFNQTWFTKQATHTDPSNPKHCIYAVSYAPTGKYFPMVWAPQIRYVHALDVTSYYLKQSKCK